MVDYKRGDLFQPHEVLGNYERAGFPYILIYSNRHELYIRIFNTLLPDISGSTTHDSNVYARVSK